MTRTFPMKPVPKPASSTDILLKRLARRLRAEGVVYATLFGSLARSHQRPDSDIDVAVSFGKPMGSRKRMAVMEAIGDIAGRPVDLIDLENAAPLVLAQALGGIEILCNSLDDRHRMADRMLRTEDERISLGIAMREARKHLFR